MAKKIITIDTATGRQEATINTDSLSETNLNVKDTAGLVSVDNVNEIKVNKTNGLSLTKTGANTVVIGVDGNTLSTNLNAGLIAVDTEYIIADNVEGALIEVVQNLNTHELNVSNPHSVTKAQVGLGNVDNTSDINKPISSATQTALNAKANTVDVLTKTNTTPYTPTADYHPVTKAYADALASGGFSFDNGLKVEGTSVSVDETELDASKIPFTQSGFTATNVKAAIIEASESGSMVETDPVFSASEAANFVTGDKNKLDGIEANANNYTLPTATDSILGGIKVGSTLSIAESVLNAKDQVSVNGVKIIEPNLTDNNYLTFSNVLSNVYATLKNITMTAKGIDSLTFDKTINRTTLAEGVAAWDKVKKCLLIGMSNGSILEVGKEVYTEFENNTGETILAGTPLFYGSSIGNSGKIRAIKGKADGTISPFLYIGLSTDDVANGETGKTTRLGDINDLNTTGTPYGETWSNGERLFVSPTTTGHITNVEPDAPNYVMQIGFVINAHAQVGNIKVAEYHNCKLTDLADVNGTPLDTTGQILIWNSTTKVWDTTDNINKYATNTNVQTALGALDARKLSATITDPVTGQVITFNGTNWVNADPSGGSTQPIYFFEGTTATELQTLINDVSAAGGGVIQLKAVTYTILLTDLTLEIPANIHIRGAGKNLTVIDFSALTDKRLIHLNGINIGFSDMSFNGQTVNTHNVILAKVVADYFFLKNVNITNYKGNFVQLLNEASTMKYSIFENIFITNPQGAFLSHSNFGGFTYAVVRNITAGQTGNIVFFNTQYSSNVSYENIGFSSTTSTMAMRVSNETRLDNITIKHTTNNAAGGVISFNVNNSGNIYISKLNLSCRGTAFAPPTGQSCTIYISDSVIGNQVTYDLFVLTGHAAHSCGMAFVLSNCYLSSFRHLFTGIGGNTANHIFTGCNINLPSGSIANLPVTAQGSITISGGTLVASSPSTYDPQRLLVNTRVGNDCYINNSIVVDGNLKVGSGDLAVNATTGVVSMGSTPVYADNAAALTGGLVAGDIYKTATGEIRIVV